MTRVLGLNSQRSCNVGIVYYCPRLHFTPGLLNGRQAFWVELTHLKSQGYTWTECVMLNRTLSIQFTQRNSSTCLFFFSGFSFSESVPRIKFVNKSPSIFCDYPQNTFSYPKNRKIESRSPNHKVCNEKPHEGYKKIFDGSHV